MQLNYLVTEVYQCIENFSILSTEWINGLTSAIARMMSIHIITYKLLVCNWILLVQMTSLLILQPPAFVSQSVTPAPVVPQLVTGHKLRPSKNTLLNRCSLGDLTNQQQSARCYMSCLHNPCCKAVNISSCEQSYVSTEALDLVKEVNKLMMIYTYSIYNA